MSDELTERSAAEAAVVAHFGLLLGIRSPRQVQKADLDPAARRVEIVVEHDLAAAVSFPQRGATCPRHDHSLERISRHLGVIQFTTLIWAKVPQTSCPTHGVDRVRAPLAGPNSRFMLFFEAFGGHDPF